MIISLDENTKAPLLWCILSNKIPVENFRKLKILKDNMDFFIDCDVRRLKKQ